MCYCSKLIDWYMLIIFWYQAYDIKFLDPFCLHVSYVTNAGIVGRLFLVYSNLVVIASVKLTPYNVSYSLQCTTRKVP